MSARLTPKRFVLSKHPSAKIVKRGERVCIETKQRGVVPLLGSGFTARSAWADAAHFLNYPYK